MYSAPMKHDEVAHAGIFGTGGRPCDENRPYHNIRWSRYKARVFSALHRLVNGGADEVRFFQIADTDGERVSLSGVEMDYHRNPHELLFLGAHDQLPVRAQDNTLFARVFRSMPPLLRR